MPGTSIIRPAVILLCAFFSFILTTGDVHGNKADKEQEKEAKAKARMLKKRYLVIDLEQFTHRFSSDGPSTYEDENCYLKELWLRRIPAGQYTEQWRERGNSKVSAPHEVFIAEDFYIGVFEITQAQCQRIWGKNPSHYKGRARPVESISYTDIFGDVAPSGKMEIKDIAPKSFLGRLNALTGLPFTLPTPEQWKYACIANNPIKVDERRARSLRDDTYDSRMMTLGRFVGNRNDDRGGKTYRQHTSVGSYAPNAWGLFDMRGNVYEICNLTRIVKVPVREKWPDGHSHTGSQTKKYNDMLAYVTCGSGWRTKAARCLDDRYSDWRRDCNIKMVFPDTCFRVILPAGASKKKDASDDD